MHKISMVYIHKDDVPTLQEFLKDNPILTFDLLVSKAVAAYLKELKDLEALHEKLNERVSKR